MFVMLYFWWVYIDYYGQCRRFSQYLFNQNVSGLRKLCKYGNYKFKKREVPGDGYEFHQGIVR